MLVAPSRTSPRWKEWIPLSSQQLRLRNVIRIIAFNVQNKHNADSRRRKKNERTSSKESHYYTLHSTTMSAPFYTSEKLESENPKWGDIELCYEKLDVYSSANAVILRLWSSVISDETDQVIAVWGIHFSGLIYIGPQLNIDTTKLGPNAVVFCMPGGYFTDPSCLPEVAKTRLVASMQNGSCVKRSYTVSLLSRLHTLQQVIRKQSVDAESLKEKISVGGFAGYENRADTLLKRLLNKSKPRVLRQDVIQIKKQIELARFRVDLLQKEKKDLVCSLKVLNKHLEYKSDMNQDKNSNIMENYRLLRKEVEIYREWRKEHLERRESQLHSRAMLNFRSKQLTSELQLIYPIVENSVDGHKICGVHLPNSEDLAGHDELAISVALGYVTHVVQMISVFLQVPLRYPVLHLGSRSCIIDPITEMIPDKEREFPLYSRGKDKIQFHYAVYLLNKDIAQLRWLYGLGTQDLRNTLSNLASLTQYRSSSSFDDGNNSQSILDMREISVASPLVNFPFSKSPHIIPEFDSNTSVPSYAVSHHISKSSDSPGDLVLSNKENSRSLSALPLIPSVGNSFSYSLDKGLNEYEEIKKAEKSLIVSSPSTSVACPLNHIGSEPSLFDTNHTCNLSKLGPTPIDIKKDFLESWQASKDNNLHTSEDDIETSNIVVHDVPENLDNTSPCDSPARTEDTRSVSMHIPRSIQSTTTLESSVPHLADQDVHVKQTSSLTDSKTTEISCDIISNLEKVSDCSNVPQVQTFHKCEIITEAGQSKIIDTREPSVLLPNEENLSDVEHLIMDNSYLSSDGLLESVTSRTEALANQTTTFNRFRSRFKSTLES